MNAQEFAYWLQGFFELTGSKKLTQKQVEQIKDHLQLVFTKVTHDHNPPIAPLVLPKEFDMQKAIEELLRKPNNPPPVFPGQPITPWVPNWPGLKPWDITCCANSTKLPDGIKDEVYC